MITGYYANTKTWTVDRFECEVFGYPHRTTTGDEMYENIHFLDEGKAWDRLRAEAEAGVKLAAHDKRRAEKNLADAEKAAAAACMDMDAVLRGWKAFTERPR